MYTRLEAINLMLEATGQLPVTSEDIQIPATIAAQSTLDRVTKREQVRGFWFNTDYGVTLTRTTDGEVPLPQNTIQVLLDESPMRGVVRDGKLYDSVNNTLSWDEDPYAVKLIRALDFSECAPSYQTLAMYAAAMEFQAMREGDPTKYQDISQQAQGAALGVRREHNKWIKESQRNNPMYRKYMSGFHKMGNVLDPTFPGGRRRL